MLVEPTQDFEIKHHKKHMLHNMLNVILFKYCRERYFTSFRELYKYASQGNLIFLNSSHHLNLPSDSFWTKAPKGPWSPPLLGDT